jgi:hypothetical protein
MKIPDDGGGDGDVLDGATIESGWTRDGDH